MKYSFDKIVNRKDTCSLKWDFCGERFGRSDILPMWVADMDFESPAEIKEAIIKRAQHGVFGYTGVPDRLNYAFTSWMKRRNGWDIDQAWILHTPGVVTSVNNAVLAYTKVGDKILLQTPIYYPFFSSILDNGRVLATNSLVNRDGHFEIDFVDFEAKLADGVKMFILCSPHNPIGRVWTEDELNNIAELCVKYSVLVVSDEIHSDIIYKGHKHISLAMASDKVKDNSITCFSPTKTFNLAGLSESVVIIPNEGLRKMFQNNLRNTGAGMLNIFGQVAAEAAYTYDEPWLEELLAYLTNNLEFLTDYFRERIPEIKVIKPEGTYLAWLDCRELPIKAEKLKEFFVFKAGVGMNDGAQFGKEGSGYQRINFACPRELLQEGLQRIERALKEEIR